VDFKGKNVIVTGGSKGLGYEICKHFLQQGANVSLCARNPIDLFKADNSLMQFKTETQILHSMSVDVSDYQSIKEYIFEAEKALGEIDILVSNAGVIGSKGLIEDVDIEEWTQSVAINLFSNLYLFKTLIPKMKENNNGRIVVISGGGATKPLINMSAYGASKAGLVRLAETVAKECEGFNIKINCLAPGALNTSILDEMLENKDNINEDFYDKCLKQKEQGGDSIEHAAEVCLRLCKEDVKITGKLISAVWDDLESIICEEIDSDAYTIRRLVPANN
jgi:3-oxoacyl-[acyl-carrier protein] reductase